MIVYLARAIQAFVMYCVNGTSRSSLLIESTDSMTTDSMIVLRYSSVCVLYCIVYPNSRDCIKKNIYIYISYVHMSCVVSRVAGRTVLAAAQPTVT